MYSAVNNQKPEDSIGFPVVILSSRKDAHTGKNIYIEWVAFVWTDLT